MINIFYLLLLFSFFCLMLMVYYYFQFLNTNITGNTFKDLIIVYHRNFGSYTHDPEKTEYRAYIYWDPKEKLMVYNHNLIHFYGRSIDLYVKLFGFNALIRRIYFKEDLENFNSHSFSWSVIFSDLLSRSSRIWKDKDYWFSLFKSFILFVLVLFILFLLPNLFSTEFLDYLTNLRKFLILLFFFILLFIIYKILYNQKHEEEYIADYPYIKLLVLFWKLGINAIEFFNNFLCIIFNLFLLILIFNYFNLNALLTKTLIIYFAIIWIINILNLLVNRFLNAYIEKSKIIEFLSKTSFKSFLLFPLACFILYIIFKIYWWIKFILLSLRGKKREFLFAYLKDIFLNKDNYNYPYVFRIYLDEELDKHLARIYFSSNYRSSYCSLIGQKEFDKILETKRE